MSFTPKFLATGIGSMPFTDAGHAVAVSLSCLSDAPFWPQLPQRGLNEQMEIQYAEGLPSAVIDRTNNRMYFDTAVDYSEAFAGFYEAYIAAMDPDEGSGDCSAMAISPDHALGLHTMLRSLEQKSGKLPFVKVQTTGPCTVGLSVVDEQKRAIYYNEEFRDVLVKAAAMKCRWQIQKFRPYAEKVICFIDEPVLSGFGSSTYVSVKREDIVAMLNEVIQAVHADDAISGIHCCGNTEWSILVDAGVDIVNFDAFGFGDSILMYPDAVKSLLNRGGALAWGIVPTSAAIREHTVETLAAKLNGLIDQLAAKGIDRQLLCRQAVLTPSCGTGTMSAADAERVFEVLAGLSKAMRESCRL